MPTSTVEKHGWQKIVQVHAAGVTANWTPPGMPVNGYDTSPYQAVVYFLAVSQNSGTPTVQTFLKVGDGLGNIRTVLSGKSITTFPDQDYTGGGPGVTYNNGAAIPIGPNTVPEVDVSGTTPNVSFDFTMWGIL